jgi:hypothetical protein
MTTGSNTRAAGHFAAEHISQSFPTLWRYWHDPEYRAAMDAETQAHRQRMLAEDQRRVRAAWERTWVKYGEQA